MTFPFSELRWNRRMPACRLAWTGECGAALKELLRGENFCRGASDVLKLERRYDAREAMGGAMRLLLVEDDPILGNGIEAGLKQAGFTVDWAQDGRSAQLALETTAYELVVLDLGLPRVTGMDLLRDWKSTRLNSSHYSNSYAV